MSESSKTTQDAREHVDNLFNREANLVRELCKHIDELDADNDELHFQLGTLKDTLKSYQRGTVSHTKFLEETKEIYDENKHLKAKVKHTLDYCKARVGIGLMSISAAAAITGLPYVEVRDWPMIDTRDCKTFAEQIAKAERIVKERK